MFENTVKNLIDASSKLPVVNSAIISMNIQLSSNMIVKDNHVTGVTLETSQLIKNKVMSDHGGEVPNLDEYASTAIICLQDIGNIVNGDAPLATLSHTSPEHEVVMLPYIGGGLPSSRGEYTYVFAIGGDDLEEISGYLDPDKRSMLTSGSLQVSVLFSDNWEKARVTVRCDEVLNDYINYLTFENLQLVVLSV